MPHPIATLLLAASLAAVPVAQSQQPPAAARCAPAGGKLALVLPGGGAKGFAHLGVLRMLDSLGIVPDLIVGTSAGAIMGALYASGLEVPEIDRQVKGLGLDTLVGRYRASTPPSLGTRRAVLAWEGGRQGFTLQTSVVRETPLNALISALYARGNLLAGGDFDRLPIPFRAVAADIHTRAQVVLDRGDLAEAVRASGSIPLVLHTVRADGRDLVDGGIANNIPVDVARSLGATHVIVSGLRDTSTMDLEDDAPLTIAAQLLAFLFDQPAVPVHAGDVMLTAEVSGVNQFDFSPTTIDRVIAAGEKSAMALRDDRCLTRGRRRPRGELPPIASSLVAAGTDPELARVLRRTLGDIGGRAVDLPLLQARLRALSQVDRYRAIWLHPQPLAGDSILFAAEGRLSSNEQLLVGGAFDRELGPRIWIGRVQRLQRRNAEVTAVMAIGQFQQELSLSLRHSYDQLGSPWSPLLSGAFTRTQVRDIRDGREFPDIPTADWQLESGVERRFSRNASVALTAFVRQWDEPVYAGTPTGAGTRLRLLLLGAAHQIPRGIVEFEGTARYWRGAIELRRQRYWRDFTVETTLSAVLGEHLPLQSSAFLGGNDVGFPGYKLQELRGAQAASAAVHVAHAIYGPLSVQGLVSGGALQQTNHGVFDDARGYFGARAGLGVTTALGPVAIEYGVNDRGRSNLWMRFGDWF